MRERFGIAADLREIARLLEIKGENPFKTQAYERGASALENHEGDFDALVKTGRLTEIAGIGNALAAIYRGDLPHGGVLDAPAAARRTPARSG